jgi:hypothetical protein
MGLGSSSPPQHAAQGRAVTQTTITDTKTKAVLAEQVRYPYVPPTHLSGTGMVARVGNELGTGMCLNYQTVTTRSWCELPCEATPEARAAASQECVRFNEEQLIAQTGWVRETIQTMVDAKLKYEGR